MGTKPKLKRRTKHDIIRVVDIHGHAINIYSLKIETGEYLEVPSFIVRNPKLKGWQVRMARLDFGYHSEYYPDEGREPKTSLKEATRGLKRILEGVDHRKRSNIARTERKKGLRTGFPGVAYKWLLNRVTGIYNLRIEVRAGFGSRRDKESIVSIYVGTEMTVTEEVIRERLHKAAGKRRKRVEFLLREYQEVQSKRGRSQKRMLVPMEEIENALEANKARNEHLLEEIVREKLEIAMKGPEHLQAWRGVSLKRKTLQVKGEMVKVPHFVSREDDLWIYEIRLPDGVIFGDSIPVSDSLEQDMREILFDCMYEAARASRPIPRASVYGQSANPRFSKLPLEVIERMNAS